MPNTNTNSIFFSVMTCLVMLAALTSASTAQAQTATFEGTWSGSAGDSGTTKFVFAFAGGTATFTANFTGTIFGAVNPSIGPLNATANAMGDFVWEQTAHPVFGDLQVTLDDDTAAVTFASSNVPAPGLPLSGTGGFAVDDINSPTNSFTLNLAQTGLGGVTASVTAALVAAVPTLPVVLTVVLFVGLMFTGVMFLRRRTELVLTD